MILLETNKWLEVLLDTNGENPIIRSNKPRPKSVLWMKNRKEIRPKITRPKWQEDTKLASIYDVHILGVYK